MYSIEVLDNKSEVLGYTVPDMPIKATIARQDDQPYITIVNHWHHDLEFTYVLKGSLVYCVDGVTCTLTEGQMIFVNAGRMHYTVRMENEPCEFACTIFHPSMLDSKLSKPYLDRIAGNAAPAFMILHPELPREKHLIDLVLSLHRSSMEREEGYELRIMAAVYGITAALLELSKAAPDAADKPDAKQLESMRRMVGFIQKHYAEKILLTQIATAGFVSRSGCSSIFKRYLDKTPMEYLTEYRISKSCEQLELGELSITEIAAQCGFCGSSYYTETFRKVMGCTPSEYRTRYRG